MKLRIRGNSIRLRLTKTEVADLSDKGSVEEKTDFGNGICLFYSIISSDSTETVKADFTNNRLEIILPEKVANDWANSETVGLSAIQNNLKLLIEKDFSCLVPRTNDDDSDTFSHPKMK
jgi:hypothetical protein